MYFSGKGAFSHSAVRKWGSPQCLSAMSTLGGWTDLKKRLCVAGRSYRKITRALWFSSLYALSKMICTGRGPKELLVVKCTYPLKADKGIAISSIFYHYKGRSYRYYLPILEHWKGILKKKKLNIKKYKSGWAEREWRERRPWLLREHNAIAAEIKWQVCNKKTILYILIDLYKYISREHSVV